MSSIIEQSKNKIEQLLGINYEDAIDDIQILISEILNEEEINIAITGVEFTGSQRFGNPNENSDLDVVFTYESIDERVKEDYLFNILNEESIYYYGFKLDINPIEDGNIDNYILNASKYKKDLTENLQPFELEKEKDRIRDIIDIMKNIQYGFINQQTGEKITDRDFIHHSDISKIYKTNADPRKTIRDKLGICKDQSLAFKYLMNNSHPEDTVTLYALTTEIQGHCVPTYNHGKKWYYIEFAWNNEYGLHGPFDSQEELEKYLNFVYYKNHKEDNNLTGIKDVTVDKITDEKTLLESRTRINENLPQSAFLLRKDGKVFKGMPNSYIDAIHPHQDKFFSKNSYINYLTFIYTILTDTDIKKMISDIIYKKEYDAQKINKIIRAYHEEVCEVRLGGKWGPEENKEKYIYIRYWPSSFNWFDTIWMFIEKNRNSIEYVTIERYLDILSMQTKSTSINGIKLSNIPVDDFLTLPGNPVLESLKEDTRSQLIAKSRNADEYKDKTHGKNRFERKKYVKVATQVKAYNNIDMDDFIKRDTLTLNIPVTGETNNYTVSIRLSGVFAEIVKLLKSNKNIFEYKIIIQAVSKVFNIGDVRVRCDCDDFRFRYKHMLIINNNSVDDTSDDPGPGRTGMANTTGKGCKHILAVLSNLRWINEVSSCIKNYIMYMAEHRKDIFSKIIFPRLYGVPVDAASEENLLPDDFKLDSNKNLIDEINEWAKNRGKIKAGSTINPAKGKGQIQGPNTEEQK